MIKDEELYKMLDDLYKEKNKIKFLIDFNPIAYFVTNCVIYSIKEPNSAACTIIACSESKNNIERLEILSKCADFYKLYFNLLKTKD
jgi:hypothetical protein